MEWTLKTVAIMVLLLVFVLVVTMLIASSGDASHNMLEGLKNFFQDIISGGASAGPEQASPDLNSPDSSSGSSDWLPVG